MTRTELSRLFAGIDVGEVWGIGPRLSRQLQERGIGTVEALRIAEAKTLRREFSVVMEKTIAELNGTPCIELEHHAPDKQQIMSSRSFGNYVYDLEPLQEAVASYIAIAAEKLRYQGSAAGMVQVYVRTNPHKDDHPQYQRAYTVPLPEATDDTMHLTRVALWALRRIYRPGYAYQKAGVVLMELTAGGSVQRDLFSPAKDNAMLMQTMDRINALWGRGTLRSAAEGTEKRWAMKREKMSPRWTTVMTEVPVASAW